MLAIWSLVPLPFVKPVWTSGSNKVPEQYLFLLYWLCQSFWLYGPQQTGKFLEMEMPDHQTCLLRNLYADQEATVRPAHGTTDCLHVRKGLHQSCILSPCLFNLYAEYIMWNARLDEVQAGIKIVRRNINNLTYTDDTTLMAETEEELKSPLMKVKEESEKVVLKLSI